MIEIETAKLCDSKAIDDILKRAFLLYRDALHSASPVKALSENEESIKFDIENHHVYVAKEDGVILGSIRYKLLSDSLAYIYRFGVNPDINNTGIGSDLLKKVIDECETVGITAIALHTNSKYYKLARYYYGKQFFVHSTSTEKGYIRALFIKELKDIPYDLSPAFKE